MSINRERPHLIIIPEDQADADMANGFLLELEEGRNVQVLNDPGGWSSVVDEFCKFEAARMRRYPARRVILLIDFDGRPERLQAVKRRIPEDVLERVFVIGPLTTPQELRTAIGTSLERIGGRLARECRGEASEVWEHALLMHNASEVTRLREDVRHFLF